VPYKVDHKELKANNCHGQYQATSRLRPRPKLQVSEAKATEYCPQAVCPHREDSVGYLITDFVMCCQLTGVLVSEMIYDVVCARLLILKLQLSNLVVHCSREDTYQKV